MPTFKCVPYFFVRSCDFRSIALDSKSIHIIEGVKTLIPNLPKSIEIYFTNDRADAEGLELCFTENAFVKDDGHTHTGIAAIKAWKADVVKKYANTSEPLRLEESHGKIIVTSRETGNFPGSPIEFRYTFGMEGDKIASLEVQV